MEITPSDVPEICFEGPEGDLIPNPTAEQIQEIFEKGEGLWQAAAGWLGWVIVGAQGYRFDLARTSMAFVVVEGAGVHPLYRDGDKSWTVDCEEGQSELVEVSLGGEPYFIPRSAFVSKGSAREIVQTFLESQSTWTGVTWRRTRESGGPGLEYMHHYPQDRKM